MSKEVAEVLRRARAKIERPKHWGRDWFAYTPHGLRVQPEDPAAVKWCAVGALLSVVPSGTVEGNAMDMLRECLPSDRWTSVPLFNDAKSTRHADILNLYDRAIAKAEADSDA